jgi:branched-chain amino acid transport system substrate-binding protein
MPQRIDMQQHLDVRPQLHVQPRLDMRRDTRPLAAWALAAGLAAMSATPAAEGNCTITIGVVMELTGTAGEYGQAAAKSVEMALRDLNDAGGARGCRLVPDIKDTQGQATVAVDAANQLVQLEKVPVIIGSIASSTTIPILTSVAGPAKVVQMSPAASSPKLTALARDAKSNGMFFRTVTSDALQGSVAAKFALDRGMRRLAVIYVNDDFGVGLYGEFSRAFKALGGAITSATPYEERQANYASEVTAAMGSEPEGLYLISTPVEGAAIARAWISLGGPRRFLLNDGMNSAAFITAVGAKYLNDAYGTSSGTTATPSTRYFYEQYQAFARLDPGSPAADRAYDAGAVIGLAVAAADSLQSSAIRAAIFKVTDPKGIAIYAGKDEFSRGLALLREGKAIRYQGVIGPVVFDNFGDISGPFRLWRISGGIVTTMGEMGADDVGALKARIGG